MNKIAIYYRIKGGGLFPAFFSDFKQSETNKTIMIK